MNTDEHGYEEVTCRWPLICWMSLICFVSLSLSVPSGGVHGFSFPNLGLFGFIRGFQAFGLL
jgi:hypothetical protein